VIILTVKMISGSIENGKKLLIIIKKKEEPFIKKQKLEEPRPRRPRTALQIFLDENPDKGVSNWRIMNYRLKKNYFNKANQERNNLREQRSYKNERNKKKIKRLIMKMNKI